MGRDFAGAVIATDKWKYEDQGAYFATGSGVTPNQASSVIQMPSSYLEKIL